MGPSGEKPLVFRFSNVGHERCTTIVLKVRNVSFLNDVFLTFKLRKTVTFVKRWRSYLQIT